MKLIMVLAFIMTLGGDSDIRQVMDQQVVDWNKGNIDGFMEGYWKSDELTFVGKSGITKGWDNTIANYKKSYDSKEKMGVLSFDIKSVDLITDKDAIVLGQWSIQRTDEKIGGYFTLRWKKMDGKWLIISDHTS